MTRQWIHGLLSMISWTVMWLGNTQSVISRMSVNYECPRTDIALIWIVGWYIMRLSLLLVANVEFWDLWEFHWLGFFRQANYIFISWIVILLVDNQVIESVSQVLSLKIILCVFKAKMQQARWVWMACSLHVSQSCAHAFILKQVWLYHRIR